MTGLPCTMRIPGGEWPARTPALVARDRQRWPMAVGDVTNDRIGRDTIVEVEPQHERRGTPELADDRLIEVLHLDVPIRAAAAAFVAGRCTTADPAADAAIAAALRDVVEAVETSGRFARMARPYVEGVFSLALLGDATGAIGRLRALLADPERRSTADHLAAGYLAQLGDPAGYPVLLDDLHDRDSDQVRMMALEELVAFAPHVGATVGEVTVDVAGELRRALRDKEHDVAIEAVRVTAEAQLPESAAILREATARPHSKKVIAAAKWTIDQLAGR